MIGIICAMKEEVKSIYDLMQNKFEYKMVEKEITIGKINGKQIALIISGIGTTNAAIAAMVLINQFDLKKIYNFGTAGGCHKDSKIGDIVIANGLLYLDVDLRAFDYQYGQIPKLPSVFSAKTHYYNYIKSKIKNLNITQGIVGTTNKFINNSQEITDLQKISKDFSVIDMESTAIAQTCFLAKIDFICIKVVSDVYNNDVKNNAIQFDDFIVQASYHYQEILVELLNYKY